MNEDTVVDNIFCSDSEDDWNESDEEDTFAHDEHSVVLDPLAREQEGKMVDNGLARVLTKRLQMDCTTKIAAKIMKKLKIAAKMMDQEWIRKMLQLEEWI